MSRLTSTRASTSRPMRELVASNLRTETSTPLRLAVFETLLDLSLRDGSGGPKYQSDLATVIEMLKEGASDPEILDRL